MKPTRIQKIPRGHRMKQKTCPRNLRSTWPINHSDNDNVTLNDMENFVTTMRARGSVTASSTTQASYISYGKKIQSFRSRTSSGPTPRNLGDTDDTTEDEGYPHQRRCRLASESSQGSCNCLRRQSISMGSLTSSYSSIGERSMASPIAEDNFILKRSLSSTSILDADICNFGDDYDLNLREVIENILSSKDSRDLKVKSGYEVSTLAAIDPSILVALSTTKSQPVRYQSEGKYCTTTPMTFTAESKLVKYTSTELKPARSILPETKSVNYTLTETKSVKYSLKEPARIPAKYTSTELKQLKYQPRKPPPMQATELQPANYNMPEPKATKLDPKPAKYSPTDLCDLSHFLSYSLEDNQTDSQKDLDHLRIGTSPIDEESNGVSSRHGWGITDDMIKEKDDYVFKHTMIPYRRLSESSESDGVCCLLSRSDSSLSVGDFSPSSSSSTRDSSDYLADVSDEECNAQLAITWPPRRKIRLNLEADSKPFVLSPMIPGIDYYGIPSCKVPESLCSVSKGIDAFFNSRSLVHRLGPHGLELVYDMEPCPDRCGFAYPVPLREVVLT